MQFFRNGKAMSLKDVVVQVNVRVGGAPDACVQMCDIGAGLKGDTSAVVTTQDNTLQKLAGYIEGQNIRLPSALRDIQEELAHLSGQPTKLELQGPGARPGQFVYNITFVTNDENANARV